MTAKGRVDAKPRCMIIAGPDGTPIYVMKDGKAVAIKP
jgi:hypothetical protein